MPKRMTAVFLAIMAAVSLTGMAQAKNDVGSVIAVRNRAVIERDNKQTDAKVKDGVLSIDTVTTLEDSRAKMLFSNDSVVTLGENSRLVVEEYLYSEGKRGKSVFNLIDGKMRAVVGNTDFEIHTPSAVAAARGTVILSETWYKGGEQCKFKKGSGEDPSKMGGCKKCTTIVSREGNIGVSNLDNKVPGSVQLTQGWKTDVCEGEGPSEPEIAPSGLMDRLSGDTDVDYHEISIPEPVETAFTAGVDTDAQGVLDMTPPLDQQPVGETASSVSVNILFP